ncbi:MAG: T9SS type A sorting domain-containing protein [Bacteroidetes bacterium]|nr:MAG: T9SS type A sorting domain-containing protein [Bacteroidota bacterium]
MMKYFLITALILCSITAANAQGVDNQSFIKRELKKFAKEQNTLWRANRAQAESVATANGLPITFTVSDSTETVSAELQRMQDSIPIYFKTTNVEAATTISTNLLWPGQLPNYNYNLTGTGVKLGVWDQAKVKFDHPEFSSGRAVDGPDVGTINNYYSDHSTHVAGTMIANGTDLLVKGMSYQGSIQSYDWNNNISELSTAASKDLIFSNHSYGIMAGWTKFKFTKDGPTFWGWLDGFDSEDDKYGRYFPEAKNFDNFAALAPYHLVVKAAGNDRGRGPNAGTSHYHLAGNTASGPFTDTHIKNGGTNGYDCLPGDGVAKNILMVGAVEDLSNPASQPPVMTLFSSWGPTDDGRIKPDIVANGYRLYSTTAHNNNLLNNDGAEGNYYTFASGTSMASPTVTGSLGLLQQLQKKLNGTAKLWSSTWKALLIHSANEAGLNTGPDYEYGWGLMNTKNAAQIMRAHKNAPPYMFERKLSQGGTIKLGYLRFAGSKVKATMCWTDPAGTPPAATLDPTNIMLVNDLDMRIKEGLTTTQPWVLNPSSPSSAATTGDNIRDNVEQAFGPTGGAIFYIKSGTVEISHKGTLSGGAQNVSIIMTGQLNFINVASDPSVKKLYAVKLRPGGGGTAVGPKGALLSTTDGGKNWTLNSSFPKLSFNDVDFSDSLNGWIVGEKGIILKTTDGGTTWTQVVSTIKAALYTVNAFDNSNVLAAGKSGLMYKTTDGGISWTTVTTSVKNNIEDIEFVNATTGWAVGTKGCILKTTDGGSTFVTQLSGTKNDIKGISFLDSTTAWAVGNKGTMIKTTDGGLNWTQFPSGVTNDLNAVHFGKKEDAPPKDNSDCPGIVCGKDGLVLLTVDGGSSWQTFAGKASLTKSSSLDPGTKSKEPSLYAIDFTSDGYAAVVGDKGQIKILTDSEEMLNDTSTSFTGQTNEIDNEEFSGEETAPVEFGLHQNYPNPFNPTTMITYEVPVNGYVTLKVFNTLGQEVATLLNHEETEAGISEIAFNANGLPSGIYFYRITVEATESETEESRGQIFFDVKKMVLLK